MWNNHFGLFENVIASRKFAISCGSSKRVCKLIYMYFKRILWSANDKLFRLCYQNYLSNKLIQEYKESIPLFRIVLLKQLKWRENKIGFRPVSRQQQDRFRNKLFCRLFSTFFAAFFAAFFATFLSTFWGMLFGMLFWVHSTKVALFWGCSTRVYCNFFVGGVSVKVFLRTACCCQKQSNKNFKNKRKMLLC